MQRRGNKGKRRIWRWGRGGGVEDEGGDEEGRQENTGGDFTCKSDRPLRLLRAISLAFIQQHNINNLCTGLALLCILNVFCSINNYQALNKCQGLFILLFPMVTFIIHESYKVSVIRSILKISNLRFQEVK